MKQVCFLLLLTCAGFLCNALLAQQPIVLDKKYGTIKPFHEGFARVKIDGKWGLIDKKGREIVPCVYDAVYNFFEGRAGVQRDGKSGFVDKMGKEVIPCEYQGGAFFNNGLAMVKQNDLCGFIDKAGKMVIPCKYQQLTVDTSTYKTFEQGIQWVMQNNLWGLIDKEGKQIVPCKYQKVDLFRGEYAVIVQNNLQGIIDKNDKEIVPCKYQTMFFENPATPALFSSEGLQQVMRDSLYGYIDKTGKEVIPCKYQILAFFNEGLAAVKQKGLYGFMDKTGKILIPCKYQEVYNFTEGLAIVKQKGLYGFIDKTGKEIVTCKYEDVYSFYEGLVPVKQKGLWGYIDKTGTEIIPCKYEEAYNCYMGIARVKQNGLFGFIDKTGTEVIPFNYQNVGRFGERLIRILENNKYGVMNTKGELIVAPKYQSIDTFSQGIYPIKYENRYGFIDKNAKEVIPPTYTYLENFSDSIAIGKISYDTTVVIEGIKLNRQVEKWVLVPLPLPTKVCKQIDWNTPNLAAFGGDTEASPFHSSHQKLFFWVNYQANENLTARDFHLEIDGKKATARAIVKPLMPGKTYQDTLYLEEGLHKYEVVACGTHSKPLWVQYTKPQEVVNKPNLHIFAVGCNYTKNKQITSLSYAEADARAFVDVFKQLEGKLFKAVYIDTLIGEVAQKQKIEEELEVLQNRFGDYPERKIEKEDLVLVYFSGHGEERNGNAIYFPYNYNSVKHTTTTVSIQTLYDFLEPIKCKKIVFSDFCKSGNFSHGKDVEIQDPLYFEAVKKLVTTETGMMQYVSCVGVEKSYESETFQHGIFTQALLEATLEKKAVYQKLGNSQEEVLTMENLEKYITKRVPELLLKAGIKANQTPRLDTNYMDKNLPIYVK